MEKNKLNSLYFKLTRRILTPTILGLLVGIFSGILINLFTNFVKEYYISILLIGLVILFLVLLIKLFEKYSLQFIAKKHDNKDKSDDENWYDAITDNTCWRKKFFIILFLILVFLCMSIVSINYNSNNVMKSNLIKEERITKAMLINCKSIRIVKNRSTIK